MVVLFVVFLEGFRAEALRLPRKLVALFDGERRDSHVSEGEMIGAVIAALLRPRIGIDLQPHAFGNRLYNRPGRGPFCAIDHYIARAAERAEGVVIDGERRFSRRDLGMSR